MVANKAWIKDLKNGIEGEVRALGKVSDRYSGEKYASVTIFDCSGDIRVKVFGDAIRLLEGVEDGDVVDVFGVVKEYQNEKYVLANIVRKVDDGYLALREAELGGEEVSGGGAGEKTGREVETDAKAKADAEVKADSKVKAEEEEDPKPEIIRIIREGDTGDGVSYETISSSISIDNEKLQEAIGELMASGELYEPKYGRYKLI